MEGNVRIFPFLLTRAPAMYVHIEGFPKAAPPAWVLSDKCASQAERLTRYEDKRQPCTFMPVDFVTLSKTAALNAGTDLEALQDLAHNGIQKHCVTRAPVCKCHNLLDPEVVNRRHSSNKKLTETKIILQIWSPVLQLHIGSTDAGQLRCIVLLHRVCNDIADLHSDALDINGICSIS